MNVKIISGASFLLAMLLIVLFLMHVSIPFLSRVYMVYGAIGLGVVGIILNLLNVQNSKHSIVYSIVYWCACLLILIGIGMKTLHLPYYSYILYAGFGLTFISFFIPKYVKEEKGEDLLDNI